MLLIIIAVLLLHLIQSYRTLFDPAEPYFAPYHFLHRSAVLLGSYLSAYLLIAAANAETISPESLGWAGAQVAGTALILALTHLHPWGAVFSFLPLYLPLYFKLLPFAGTHFPLIMTAAMALLIYRQLFYVEALHAPWTINMRAIIYSFIGVIASVVIAIPLGQYLGIISLSFPAVPIEPLPLLKYVIYGYFCVALPEEILFRGVLLALLIPACRSRVVALFVSSALFGAAHFGRHLHGSALFGLQPFTQWQYPLLAGCVGLIYGLVWLKTQRIPAAALTHTLVNFIRYLCVKPF